MRNFIEAKESDPGLAARYVFMVSRRSHIAAFTLTRGTARQVRSVKEFHQLNGASFLRSTDASYMGAPEYLPLLQLLRLHPGTILNVHYSELYEAFVEGRGDVAVTWLNLLPDVQAIAGGRDMHVQAFPFHKAGLNVYGSGIVASQYMINVRPEVLLRFIVALREALQAVRRDPGIALRVFQERYPDRDPERAIEVWNAGKQLIFGDDDAQDALGTMDTATWQATIEHHARSYGSANFSPCEAFDPTVGSRTTSEG
ncbi:MAG: ABC transporter substrate-binding protein [Actinomycetota bacterium]|nr:ABC transporter substrate-binding protein [Actinomycetota bacterium]